jgi:hypothetical protein
VAATAVAPQQLTKTGPVTISNAQATAIAKQSLASRAKALPMQISNPSITFRPSGATLSARVQDSGAQVVVTGMPVVRAGRLRFQLTSLKLGGFEVPFYRREVENAANSVFDQMLAGKRVQSVQLGNGTITVTPA